MNRIRPRFRASFVCGLNDRLPDAVYLEGEGGSGDRMSEYTKPVRWKPKRTIKSGATSIARFRLPSAWG